MHGDFTHMRRALSRQWDYAQSTREVAMADIPNYERIVLGVLLCGKAFAGSIPNWRVLVLHEWYLIQTPLALGLYHGANKGQYYANVRAFWHADTLFASSIREVWDNRLLEMAG